MFDLFGLREVDIEQKLIEFKGLGNAIDDEATRKIGKLLVDDDPNEKSGAGKETYGRIYRLVGGFLPVMIFLVYAQFQKYWENYNQRIDAEFAAVDPEKQSD